MSAGIDSAAVQRTRGRRNRNTGVPGCRRGLAACDAWRDDTPMVGGWLVGWLAGWLAGCLAGYLVRQRRHAYCMEEGAARRRGRERVQRTGANFHLARGPVPPIILSLFLARVRRSSASLFTRAKRGTSSQTGRLPS